MTERTGSSVRSFAMWRAGVRHLLAGFACLSALTLGIPPCAADPDSATLQSALVWRVDGTGDYPLPELDENTTYQLPEAISTTGQIESITATWTFEGQASLELSADGGLHYTPVRYGVPLTPTVANGNRLKWRVTLGAASRLTEVKIAYTDSSKVIGAFGEPKLSGFTYRKPIVINGSSGGDLFHYQLPLLIGESEKVEAADVHCEGRVRSDFADIRLTTADGRTLLAHYVETVVGVSPARLALVWVKLPHLPLEGLTLYLYYGNPAADDLSDGRAVFEFFDDFQGSSLDPKVWEASFEGQGSATVSNSQLHLTSASILSKEFHVTDGVVEYLATTTTDQDDARLIIRMDRTAVHPDETSQVAYASAYGGAEHVLAVGNIVKANDSKPITAATPYGYRVLADGTALTFERHDSEFAEAQAKVTFDDAGGLTTGSLGLHSDGAASYDWVRVRQYAQPPPTIVESLVPPREEVVDLAVFTNLLIAPNGNLALANPSLEGIYESAGLSTDVLTRVLVPSWDGQPTTVDLSADNGRSYHLKCLPDIHYYASKGHFTPGKRLRGRISLKSTGDLPDPQLQAMTLTYAGGEVFVVSPNGGERLTAGTTHEIMWSALGHQPTYPMKLEYSLDEGKTYRLITDAADNDGEYLWILPDGVTSDETLVRVSDGYDPRVLDTSDETFSIVSQKQLASESPPGQIQDMGEMDDLMALLERLSTDPTAKPHDLLIKVTDNSDPDPEKDVLSYKAGDIVMIRPAGSEWSQTEKHSFLIIQADLAPEAVALLMSPREVPTGQLDEDGKPLTRLVARRKYRIDLTAFDLTPNPQDRGKPAVLRHFREQHDLELLLEESREDEKDVKDVPAKSSDGPK